MACLPLGCGCANAVYYCEGLRAKAIILKVSLVPFDVYKSRMVGNRLLLID
jgi:hypothetical protein